MVSDRISPPETYSLIWRLRPSGVLNLNLDGFATRAFGQVSPGRTLNQFAGKQAASYTYLLKSPEPFIANLHGTVADESSWVFTQDELQHLLRNDGYRHFVATCLSTKTIIFLGMGADDVSVSEHLKVLADFGVDFGSHYWLTHRRDSQTDRAAEKIGIRIIRYENQSGKHEEVEQFFADLLGYLPQDTLAPPVAMPTAVTSTAMPEPSVLANFNAEEIRRQLNSHVVALLSKGGDDYAEIEQFLASYDEAVYRAWYIATRPPNNILLGYEIKEQIGKGAFGRVFKAHAPDGEDVAVKVLHEEVRKTPDMLQGFRRGVRSMQILSSHKVKGMVPYRQASEVPAMAVMDYVEGPDLTEAVKRGKINSWDMVLRIAADISHIIVTAHALPERVLHRDLRPTNIMLKGFYTNPDAWEVVVLDFDLSWHRNALDVSVVRPDSASGYLAPEQVRRAKHESTRSAAVDSFGFGMTLFFLCGGEDPVFSEHQHKNWSARVRAVTSKLSAIKWKSLPRRIARLIELSTRDSQSERWDLSQIEGELLRLREANQDPSSVCSAELLAEELAALVDLAGGYSWDSDKNRAISRTPAGVEVCISGNESMRRVELSIAWTSGGQEEWKKVGKWIGDALSKAQSHLFKAMWTVDEQNRTPKSASLKVHADVNLIRKNFDQFSTAIVRAISAFKF
jgi:serine/threonine protein kinase